MADCSIVIKGINDICNVFAHINLGVPISGKKLGHSVNQIGCEDLRDHTILICLIKLFKSVAEKTEGCKGEYSVCAFVFKLLCNIYDGFA